MSVLIGGSASTGSSVLCQILNRHSKLFCGPETYLFTKSGLYKNWNGYRSRMLKKGIRGLRSESWHLYNGVDLTSPKYKLDQIDKLIYRAKSFEEFIQLFFTKVLEGEGKLKWIEKTPSNTFLFNAFLDRFPDAKIIFTVRDPYDIMASLLARGVEPFYASGICILNSLVCSNLWSNENLMVIKYEDLVVNTDSVISDLCAFIEVEMEENMLKATNAEVKMEGWQYSESEPLKPGSVGRFNHLQKEKQEQIKYLLSVIRPSGSFIKKHHIQINNMKDYCAFFGYEFRPYRFSYLAQSRYSKLKNQMIRCCRFYPNSFSNYPISIST